MLPSFGTHFECAWLSRARLYSPSPPLGLAVALLWRLGVSCRFLSMLLLPGSRVSPKAASGGSGADTKPPGPAPAAQQQTVTAQPLAYSIEPGAWRAPGTLPMGLSCIAAPVKQHVRLGTMQSGLATATIKEAPTPETAGGSMTTCNSAGENVQQVANLLLLLSNSA